MARKKRYKKGGSDLTDPPLRCVNVAWEPYLTGTSTTGAGGTTGSGLEPQDALRAIPAAAARMIAIFIVLIAWLLVWVLGTSDSKITWSLQREELAQVFLSSRMR